MAVSLSLSTTAKTRIVRALEDDLTHVFLAKEEAVIALDQKMHTSLPTETGLPVLTSDGSSRIKQLTFLQQETQNAYTTFNNLVIGSESSFTNFIIREGIPVNRLIFMDSEKFVKGIITFDTINPIETSSLYVPEIKINVL